MVLPGGRRDGLQVRMREGPRQAASRREVMKSEWRRRDEEE
jgi:hypothetical protein